MKLFVIALATVIATSTAFAQEVPTNANVPTGPDVPGPTNYRTLPGGKIELVENPNDIKELLKDGTSATTYKNAFGPSGGGDQ